MRKIKIVNRNDLVCGIFKFDESVTLAELEETVIGLLLGKDGHNYESIITRKWKRDPTCYGIDVRFGRVAMRPGKYVREMCSLFNKKFKKRFKSWDISYGCMIYQVETLPNETF